MSCSILNENVWVPATAMMKGTWNIGKRASWTMMVAQWLAINGREMMSPRVKAGLADDFPPRSPKKWDNKMETPPPPPPPMGVWLWLSLQIGFCHMWSQFRQCYQLQVMWPIPLSDQTSRREQRWRCFFTTFQKWILFASTARRCRTEILWTETDQRFNTFSSNNSNIDFFQFQMSRV